MTFHELYERYAGDVRRFALFLTGDAAQADDITSETFVRAWTSRGEIRQATVKAYLFTIARNLHRDSARLDGRKAELDDRMPDRRLGTDAVVERRLELDRVMQGMKALPALDRTVLLLRIHDEMSYEEIGEAVGLEPAAVRMRVYRARLKLAEGR
jgi:RNA polymerase sigma-70 factor (ECF subfamily)